ncbi:MAG: MATE family efflux transporter [Planctomycetota bacterium]
MGTTSFATRPHRTVLALSVPVLLSLIAEPLKCLVDTAFVKELGLAEAAALGVGTAVLPAILWIFNFLAIGTQTEVARARGANKTTRGSAVCRLAILLSAGSGLLVALAIWPLAPQLAALMQADDRTLDCAVIYLRISVLGAPAMLATATAFGAFRGVQDVRTPLQIAVASNVLNVILDVILIPGAGPIPALGIAGAAWATVASQWAAVVWALVAVGRRLGRGGPVRLADARLLLVVGRDMLVRTGLLLLFMVLVSRAAQGIGDAAGAAHNAIRQVWLFTALALDAFAATAQVLVGHALGANDRRLARRAAGVALGWGLGTGALIGLGMAALGSWVAAELVPEGAHTVFFSAWLISALAQPLNAASFVTDGIHWGASDWRFLRNAMIAATGCGVVGLALADAAGTDLPALWWITLVWIAIRAGFGVARVWPGLGAAPLVEPAGSARR